MLSSAALCCVFLPVFFCWECESFQRNFDIELFKGFFCLNSQSSRGEHIPNVLLPLFLGD